MASRRSNCTISSSGYPPLICTWSAMTGLSLNESAFCIFASLTGVLKIFERVCACMHVLIQLFVADKGNLSSWHYDRKRNSLKRWKSWNIVAATICVMSSSCLPAVWLCSFYARFYSFLSVAVFLSLLHHLPRLLPSCHYVRVVQGKYQEVKPNVVEGHAWISVTLPDGQYRY